LYRPPAALNRIECPVCKADNYVLFDRNGTLTFHSCVHFELVESNGTQTLQAK
jgi:hypothetical protein